MVELQRAVARFRLESQGLMRTRRDLAARLSLIDRELLFSPEPGRHLELVAERGRVIGRLDDLQERMATCWARSRLSDLMAAERGSRSA